MIGKGAGGVLVRRGCCEEKLDQYVVLTTRLQTLHGEWNEKQEDAPNVFYCNKLTIAKCLFNVHDGNY